ncbi:MAG TPA: glycosyltransferase [Polyangia bacterium]|nr:glycosyltransferase [Polyangia bacterium]
MDRAPDITVVIAAHNEERRLGRCLESVQAAAAGRAVEVIVVDNCSTDGTAAVARAAGARVVAERALGAVNAKAAGVAAANAPLVAVIDADSVCPPDWLDKIARAFAGDAPLVGLSGPARYLGARRWVYAVMWLWYGFWKSVQALAGTAYYAVGTNVAFRRDAFTRAGGFDTNVLVGGDEVGLFRRLRAVGPTRYTDELWVETDPRRTEVGFLRFFFGTVLLHYVLNYPFYRLTGRSLLKRYPPGSTLLPRQ